MTRRHFFPLLAVPAVAKALPAKPDFAPLTVVSGPPGGGKTIILCRHAADQFSKDRKILYVTLEWTRSYIHQKIITRIIQNNPPGWFGHLKIVECHTSGMVQDIRAILDRLDAEQFRPDDIYIDGMHLMSTPRPTGKSPHVSIANALRDLAVERQTPIWTSMQTNRTPGYSGLLCKTPNATGFPFDTPLRFTLKRASK